MEKAYEAMVTGTMSVRKASEVYGVPRSTLHEKVTGKVALQVKSGSKKYPMDEEDLVVDCLVGLVVGCLIFSLAVQKSAMPNHERMFLAIAQQIVSTRKPGVVGYFSA